MSLEHFTQYVWQRVPELAVARYRELEPQILDIWTKEATWPRRLFELGQLLPGSLPFMPGVPNAPSPLLGTLVGGLAGAGLGYGAGWLGERMMPNRWRKGRLRNTLALMGGGLGMMPGLGMMSLNAAGGKPLNSMDLFDETGYDRNVSLQSSKDWQADHRPWLKQSGSGVESAFGFNAEEFNEAIWSDPRVNQALNLPTQAAASGLVTGAANLPGKSTKLVTPFDIARIAAGMGSGYLSGLAVGKTLGVMMGMPEDTQDKLKNTGMWAGIIANVIPIAFGAK